MTNDDDGRKPEGAPERSPKAGAGAHSGVDGNGPKRFYVQRKMAIVAQLLRGEPLELVARETNVSIARLTEWRDRAFVGAATALKERERDDRDDEMGLEGIVSKHRESVYRGGRFRHWVKIKNRAHPVFSRVQDQF